MREGGGVSLIVVAIIIGLRIARIAAMSSEPEPPTFDAADRAALVHQLEEALDDYDNLAHGDPITITDFADYVAEGECCILFVEAEFVKTAKAYEELSGIKLKGAKNLTGPNRGFDGYGTVVSVKDSKWTTIYHAVNVANRFAPVADLAKKLRTNVFLFESHDFYAACWHFQANGKQTKFLNEFDYDDAISIAKDEGSDLNKVGKKIDSYENLLAHYKVKPLVFTYNEEHNVQLADGEAERVARVCIPKE